MIVVAGEALVDLVISTDGAVTAKLGGGPFNAARTIGRLGGDVAFLGSISLDRFGHRLFDHLLAAGVRPDLTTRSDAPTTLAAAELDDSGAASYRFYLTGTSAPALDRVPACSDTVEAVHLGTLGLVLEPMAATLDSYVAGLSAATLVFLDPNCREHVVTDRGAYLARIDRMIARAHVVKISTDDADYLAPHQTPLELAHDLVTRGPRVVLITAGSAETLVVSAGGVVSVPISPITVADTIGAGDSFGGGFLACWVQSGLGVDDLGDIAAVTAATAAANAVAGVTCQRVGADPPWRRDLAADWGLLR